MPRRLSAVLAIFTATPAFAVNYRAKVNVIAAEMFLNQSRARLQVFKRRIQKKFQIVVVFKSFARYNFFRNQIYLPPKTFCNFTPKIAAAAAFKMSPGMNGNTAIVNACAKSIFKTKIIEISPPA